MRRNVAVCAILLAMGLGAKTYFLTVKDGRICYREVPGSALVDTGRSVSMPPRAEDRALLSQGPKVSLMQQTALRHRLPI